MTVGGREPGPINKLSLEEEDVLLRRYASARRPELENEIVQRFLPLAKSLAGRYRSSAERDEDLMQVASLALVKALRRYDPERGSFAAYAAPSILGELRRYFRDQSWRVHIPRGLQERIMKVERATSDLTDELGRAPTMAELAEQTGLGSEDLLDAIQAGSSQWLGSLDVTVGGADEPESTTLVETMGKEEGGYEAVESQLAIDQVADLSDREREVIELRFVEGLSQHEIGGRVGVSQMQVSRDMRRGLAKLLEAVQGDEAPEGKRTFEDDGSHDPRFPQGKSRGRGKS